MFNIYYRVVSVNSDNRNAVDSTITLISKYSKALGMFWDAVYCCFDSPPYLRKALYPAYKANRNDGDGTSESTLIKPLKELGFTVLQQAGFEADDLIAQICTQFPDDRKVIISTDEDLYQLLSKNAVIYNTKTVVTEAVFVKKYGIVPKNWATVKAIAGCSSDNIQGIKGIGEKTAIAYLLNTSSHKQTVEIQDNGAAITANMFLTQLPFTYLDKKLKAIEFVLFYFNLAYAQMFFPNARLMEEAWVSPQASLFDLFG